MKIAHLTSVHQRFDTRIFLKQCKSLSRKGWDVSLVVADGKNDEKRDSIDIYDVGIGGNRIERFVLTTTKIFAKALELNAEIYHLHDPELIPIGLRLKKVGKIVVFDSHEDVPLQIKTKPYLGRILGMLVAGLYKLYEKSALKKFDLIVTSTTLIRDKMKQINPDVIEIQNFPMIDEFPSEPNDWQMKENQVCYIGSLTAIRGIKEMVKAISLTNSDTRLVLGGSFSETSFEKKVKSLEGWKLTEYKGFLNRMAIKEILSKSIAGLVVLHPTCNHMDALPVKMFEYMSAGIPVIASNIPLWESIVLGNNCGYCVDPFNSLEIAHAIEFFVSHPAVAETMGQNGRKAVRNLYNWQNEEIKLINAYEKLASQKFASQINSNA
ncbi:MAG TPA: glycosyltransferase family 4 protein [Prolixibacteraceae bacterium]|nr:glycosyltransferase family 4 protein [Prolixibacteraceae bacterium]HOR99813.1 glycosyltransferase family 4 protein [Prolixibacteraceae bacterium]HOS89703.1 glycosyltransferase family 4 protein [Prolixibacteraceae bacterium]HPL44705.1 glycosyltransferase family 4 protein [Prolixibacteraceae bacterium]HQE51376.1 glycosyltransferase family 4 protein [Prolixibacteraceae bacterium]